MTSHHQIRRVRIVNRDIFGRPVEGVAQSKREPPQSPARDSEEEG